MGDKKREGPEVVEGRLHLRFGNVKMLGKKVKKNMRKKHLDIYNLITNKPQILLIFHLGFRWPNPGHADE